MQGAKSTYGMHSRCRTPSGASARGEGATPQVPTEEVSTYAEVLKYCEDMGAARSRVTHEELCCWAHYSPGVAMGGRFTRFKC
eukprot:418596-Prymnesium_polylepis.2